MNGFLLSRNLLLIPILSIVLLSLQWVLEKTKTNFLRYILPKLHKRPYRARFIANSSSCTTTILSKLLTSCLTAVKKHWIRYYDIVYERDGINYFWSVKNSNVVLYKFKSKIFKASKLSTYDFYTLYTTLPHNLMKDKLIMVHLKMEFCSCIR